MALTKIFQLFTKSSTFVGGRRKHESIWNPTVKGVGSGGMDNRGGGQLPGPLHRQPPLLRVGSQPLRGNLQSGFRRGCCTGSLLDLFLGRAMIGFNVWSGANNSTETCCCNFCGFGWRGWNWASSQLFSLSIGVVVFQEECWAFFDWLRG